MFDKGNFKTLAQFDEAFRGSQLVSNWVGDLEMELANAAIRDAKWRERRIQFCEEFLRQFPDEDQFIRERMRRARAETTKTGLDFGKEGIPLDQLPAVTEPARQEHEPLLAAAASAVNRKIGRNEPCPCGSGKKYKKCCLPKDEAEARARFRAAEVTPSPRPDEAPIQTVPSAVSQEPPLDWNEEARGEGTLPPETERQLDELWLAFEALSKPTTEQMNTFLSRLLELPAANGGSGIPGFSLLAARPRDLSHVSGFGELLVHTKGGA